MTATPAFSLGISNVKPFPELVVVTFYCGCRYAIPEGYESVPVYCRRHALGGFDAALASPDIVGSGACPVAL